MRNLSNIAEDLIKECKLNSNIDDLFVKWDQIVGKDFSKNVEPIKVLDMNGTNVLIVRSKNYCATEIQHDSFQIIEKLNKYFQQDLVSVIRVVRY